MWLQIAIVLDYPTDKKWKHARCERNAVEVFHLYFLRMKRNWKRAQMAAVYRSYFDDYFQNIIVSLIQINCCRYSYCVSWASQYLSSGVWNNHDTRIDQIVNVLKSAQMQKRKYKTKMISWICILTKWTKTSANAICRRVSHYSF